MVPLALTVLPGRFRFYSFTYSRRGPGVETHWDGMSSDERYRHHATMTATSSAHLFKASRFSSAQSCL